MVREVSLLGAGAVIEPPVPGMESVSRGTAARSGGGGRAKINETVNFSSPGVGKHAEHLVKADELNRTAKAVRAADTALGQVSDALTEIKRALTQIVKQYPPYGIANPERIAYLNSIAGLRKQIEALAPYLSLDAGETVTMPNGSVARFGSLLSGFSGLSGVPDLGPQASDAAVADALPGVSAAIGRVGSVRLALADAVRQVTAASVAETASLRSALF